ncbi:MAG: translesion error-prone DNA polymerase V autoproteolytic subunit [Burkholderiales bacterium]|nr:translesion error-prone DNA polymerase V autoproteolytic subunit [Burkholderiales bacterium]
MLTIASRAAECPTRFVLPLIGFRVPCGFPSPADDYIEGRIDLNEHLIRNKEATFIIRVQGWSMLKAGIHDGDELIVDRSIEPRHLNVVVAIVNGRLTVKRLFKRDAVVRLTSDNEDHPDIEFKDGDELEIWGVVTTVLHKV